MTGDLRRSHAYAESTRNAEPIGEIYARYAASSLHAIGKGEEGNIAFQSSVAMSEVDAREHRARSNA